MKVCGIKVIREIIRSIEACRQEVTSRNDSYAFTRSRAISCAMSILSIEEFGISVQQGTRVMGLDVGTKTVGVALSDVLHMIASPLETVKRKKFRDDSARLSAIAEEHEVGGILLGLPLSMDGTEGPRCQSTRAFADNLGKVIDLPMVFWDERLSTSAVERMLVDDVDMTRKRRSEVIDKLAAVYILQGFLDSQR